VGDEADESTKTVLCWMPIVDIKQSMITVEMPRFEFFWTCDL
jgi:hypothetical protein